MARILVIDDEEAIRRLLGRVLQGAGHEVYQACNGKEGIRQCGRMPMDLVITDIIMPDGEGLETIIQLRQTHPGLRIFAISGGSDCLNLDILDIAASLGAARTFGKPLPMQEILKAVAEEIPQPQGESSSP